MPFYLAKLKKNRPCCALFVIFAHSKHNKIPIIMDTIIQAIEHGHISPRDICFDRIRRQGYADHGIRDQLNYGRNILSSQEQLAQYLFSYGLMVQNQWQVLASLSEPVWQQADGRVRVFDYDCGQGLGSALLLEHGLLAACGERLEGIHLIEPSVLALARAEAVLSCYTDFTVPVALVNRRLDELQPQDLVCDPNGLNIHVFSNILDVQSFDLIALFNRIIAQDGRHVFLAVSHERDFLGGDRLPGIYRALCEVEEGADVWAVNHAQTGTFVCRRGQNAEYFVFDVNVGVKA